ncbi:hypothetical protein TRAPUB_7083 [Trametes pubescens]|uniref:Uncharacterized protein n=1 Tax=Trametes pubescens TaxID=154538 RepID=A0A1M2V439_TRAPU|nr:hypothetical protein TRAPUB_7083 [Trametes pubescens]
MSRAWPNIRTLKIEWPPEPETRTGTHYQRDADSENLDGYGYSLPGADAPDRPRATLAGLVPLGRRCTALQKLEVALADMHAVPNFDGRRRPPVFLNNTEDARPLKVLRTAGFIPADPCGGVVFVAGAAGSFLD